MNIIKKIFIVILLTLFSGVGETELVATQTRSQTKKVVGKKKPAPKKPAPKKIASKAKAAAQDESESSSSDSEEEVAPKKVNKKKAAPSNIYWAVAGLMSVPSLCWAIANIDQPTPKLGAILLFGGVSWYGLHRLLSSRPRDFQAAWQNVRDGIQKSVKGFFAEGK